MQIVSLAAGLPLEWPPALGVMFDTFQTASVLGSNLLIPDCELSHLKASDAFFLKQIAIAFTVPVILILVFMAWGLIGATCAKSKKISSSDLKNYKILTIVLMLFLCYPMLVKICLSMLKCPYIGGTMYLMADLQEPCFTGRHSIYMLVITIPEIFAIVFGLPLLALVIMLRGIKQKKMHNHSDFEMRYGLLYLGYRDGREWWEVVIALRKVAIVAVGTFGTLFGLVEIQAYIALAVVFITLVLHLIGKPFDVLRKETLLLHKLEFGALAVCWGTFWGGLLFFLASDRPDSIASWVPIALTITIVLSNIFFLAVCMSIFFYYTWNDLKASAKRGRTTTVAPEVLEVESEVDAGIDGQPQPVFSKSSRWSTIKQFTLWQSMVKTGHSDDVHQIATRVLKLARATSTAHKKVMQQRKSIASSRLQQRLDTRFSVVSSGETKPEEGESV